MEQQVASGKRRYFCSGNDKQGQSRGALTYRKKTGVLQMKLLTKHFIFSIVEWALLTSCTTNKGFGECHGSLSLLSVGRVGAHG